MNNKNIKNLIILILGILLSILGLAMIIIGIKTDTIIDSPIYLVPIGIVTLFIGIAMSISYGKSKY